jgi:hypothetical protein
MTQKEAPAREEKLSSLNPAPPAIAAMAKKRFDELAEVQSDLLEEIREAHQNWLDRIQSEVALASEFTAKLTASHSIVDTPRPARNGRNGAWSYSPKTASA